MTIDAEIDAPSGALADARAIGNEVQQRGPDGLWQFIIDDTSGGSRTPCFSRQTLKQVELRFAMNKMPLH